MKIAIITSGFPPVVDGVTVLVHHRVKWLSEHGHQVALFCPDYSPIADVYPDWQQYTGQMLPGVEVIGLPSVPFFDLPYERNPGRPAHQVIETQLARFEPEVICVDEPERISMTMIRRAGLAYARRHRVPCVAYYHTNFVDYTEDMPGGMPDFAVPLVMWLGKRFIRWVYRGYDATLVNGPTTERKLADYGVHNILCDRLCGFDRDRFSPGLRQPGLLEARYGLPSLEGKTVLLTVGRLTSDKGWRFYLDAFQNIAKYVDPSTIALIIAGDGDMAEEIRTQLGAVLPHLYLLGRLSHDEVPQIMANGDLLVTASEKETFGLVCVEAAASGLPVLAPRAGGVIDSVGEGSSGLLYNPRDEDDFLAKLRTLVQDASLRHSLGGTGVASVADLGWDTTVQTWLKLLSRVVARQGAELRGQQHARSETAGDARD